MDVTFYSLVVDPLYIPFIPSCRYVPSVSLFLLQNIIFQKSSIDTIILPSNNIVMSSKVSFVLLYLNTYFVISFYSFMTFLLYSLFDICMEFTILWFFLTGISSSALSSQKIYQHICHWFCHCHYYYLHSFFRFLTS